MFCYKSRRSTGFVTFAALLVSSLLPRASLQAQESSASLPPRPTTTAQVERVLAFASVKEILAVMGETPNSVRSLLAELPDESADAVRRDLLAISPERILEDQLVANGYTPEQARETVRVLTPAEIDEVVQFDSMSGGYIVVVPVFMMMFVMVSVAVVAVAGVLIWDHARKANEARLQQQMVSPTPVAPANEQIGDLNKRLDRAREEHDVARAPRDTSHY